MYKCIQTNILRVVSKLDTVETNFGARPKFPEDMVTLARPLDSAELVVRLNEGRKRASLTTADDGIVSYVWFSVCFCVCEEDRSCRKSGTDDDFETNWG